MAALAGKKKGWLSQPSEKYEFVRWDDEIPNIWKNKKCSKPPLRKQLGEPTTEKMEHGASLCKSGKDVDMHHGRTICIWMCVASAP